MLDIHAAPTVIMYCSGQLVDEFVCGGDKGPRVLRRHVEAQIGPVATLSGSEREEWVWVNEDS